MTQQHRIVRLAVLAFGMLFFHSAALVAELEFPLSIPIRGILHRPVEVARASGHVLQSDFGERWQLTGLCD
jgi:hypothetical protein